MSLPPFLTLFNELISIPTISATDAALDLSNQALIDKLANWLSELGFAVQIDAVPNSRNKYNLLAKYGDGHGGLLLAGHTDTVPFDAGQWQRDPFKVTEQDNKLYGLGSADMKGFFAFVLDAVRNIQTQPLKKPLYILATADEETTMAGAIYFAKHAKLQPDCAIIGEPTGLIPIRAHKGHMANAIKIIGKSGHSSAPEQGINAIELMQQVISKLLQLRETLKTRYHNSSFAIPYPTLNLGSIHGGDAANRICGCCELVMDIRPLPEMSMDELYQLLCDTLAPISIEWPGRLTISYETPPIPGYECHQADPALQTVEKLLGQQAQTVNYSTEAPYINQLAPTIVLGPGSIEQAHQPDEFLDCRFIQPTQQLLQQLIQQFCY